MRNWLAVLLVSLLVLSAVGTAIAAGHGGDSYAYEDGTYRGVFIDRGGVEVVVQFSLVDDVVTSARYRLLAYRGSDYLDPETDQIAAWASQYDQVLEHLIGKNIDEHIGDLYQPGDFVDDVDTFTGATVRANKVRSALQDALNRGVYSY